MAWTAIFFLPAMIWKCVDAIACLRANWASHKKLEIGLSDVGISAIRKSLNNSFGIGNDNEDILKTMIKD